MFLCTFQLEFSNNICVLRNANNLSLTITVDCYIKGLVKFYSVRDAERKRMIRWHTVRAKLCFKLLVLCSWSWMQVVALRRLSWLPKVWLLQCGERNNIKQNTNGYFCFLFALLFFFFFHFLLLSSPKSTAGVYSKCKADWIKPVLGNRFCERSCVWLWHIFWWEYLKIIS